MSHPCLSCGACCATYRVAFHWAEAEPALGGVVPPERAVRWDAHRLAMRGTDRSSPRCESLEGSIGERVACSIYADRPTPCRDVAPSWEFGVASPQCDRARAKHGLAPLTPASWPGWIDPASAPRIGSDSPEAHQPAPAGESRHDPAPIDPAHVIDLPPMPLDPIVFAAPTTPAPTPARASCTPSDSDSVARDLNDETLRTAAHDPH